VVWASSVEGADAALTHGQRVAPAVQGSVGGCCRFYEGVEGGARAPAVDGEVARRPVCVAEEKGLDVPIRLAEEARPFAVGVVESLEGPGLPRTDLVLPEDLVHAGDYTAQYPIAAPSPRGSDPPVNLTGLPSGPYSIMSPWALPISGSL
jgi:hypothetical protein